MEKLLEILQNINSEADFLASKDFLQDGLLDSLQSMQLVMDLNDAYKIEIKGSDVVPENLCNIEMLEKLINKYI